jgi:hypothetical protein
VRVAGVRVGAHVVPARGAGHRSSGRHTHTHTHTLAGHPREAHFSATTGTSGLRSTASTRSVRADRPCKTAGARSSAGAGTGRRKPSAPSTRVQPLASTTVHGPGGGGRHRGHTLCAGAHAWCIACHRRNGEREAHCTPRTRHTQDCGETGEKCEHVRVCVCVRVWGPTHAPAPPRVPGPGSQPRPPRSLTRTTR